MVTARGEASVDRAMVAIDALHAQDPERVQIDGVTRPREQAHADVVVACLRRLAPEADDLQLLAASASHLRRWRTPRSEFPDGRAGYLRWRAKANQRHALEVGDVLRDAGYGSGEVDEVMDLVRKAGPRDPVRAQLHEDALCLAFLALDAEAFALAHGATRTAEVLGKTLAKMSERAVEVAGEMVLAPGVRELLRAALHISPCAADE